MSKWTKFEKGVIEDFIVKYNHIGITTVEEWRKIVKKTKKSKRYKRFQAKWEEFAELCEENEILAKQEWYCCDTCGWAAMDLDSEDYKAYIFYHMQDAARIYRQIQDGDSVIQVFLSWENAGWENVYFVKNIAKIAESIGCRIVYKNKRTRLSLFVPI
jgi:hypothetical protein